MDLSSKQTASNPTNIGFFPAKPLDQCAFDFDGATYEPSLDKPRLNKQLQAVFDVVKSGRWMSLSEISARTSFPEASVSARLRDLRKERFGAYTVERRRVDGGLFEYRVTA